MKESKILDRIKKLLAMANDNSSPEEAAIAAGRARKMMDKYQVSTMDLDKVEISDFGESYYFTSVKKVSIIFGRIALATAKFNDCTAVYERDDLGKTVLLFRGFVDDVQVAKEMITYLVKQANHLAKISVSGRRDIHTYKTGFTDGVVGKLNELIRERSVLKSSSGTDLVVIKKNLVEQHFGKTKTTRSRSYTSGSVESYAKGKLAGSNMNFNKLINS